MTSAKKTLDASSYDTDKGENHGYLRNYEQYLGPLAGQPIRLLELGVYHGGSVLLWRDYFEKGLIVGLDLNEVTIDDPSNRIRLYQGEQQDTALLDRIARECAPEGFDVIIDDCSHVGELARISFWHLFNNHLKSGGLYVIEDWGTGYWDSWPDGVRYRKSKAPSFTRLHHRLSRAITRLNNSAAAQRVPLLSSLASRLKRVTQKRRFNSHDFGMVGFVKELIDELGVADITHEVNGHGTKRYSRFRELRLSPSHLFVIKD
jgi:hypothetical protein